MHKILVIDDEPQIQRFMRISLTAEHFCYLEALTAAQGMQQMQEQEPHLVILDLGLPDKDGFSLLTELRQISQVPVLVLTARDEEEEKVRLLEGGANDYLSKPFGIKELIARIRVLLRDLGPMIPQTRLEFDGLSLDIDNHQVWREGQAVALSRKEFALLSYLASRPGKLVTQQQLLSNIWGDTHTEDTHYLRIFISQLRRKLADDAGSPKLIQTEPGVGYRFIAEPGKQGS
ncbi:response regulator [Bowmanella yangjiangensis]|uniref:Response regulator transcription factor n=1 Tax=Bowmanella yangjiangensis TaxID=2811230 RepID=A0ABS3CNW8_9ALTE|nr:response regulator transcription factor [Bowmanella yangjiangensis]MBN7818400.1 response regulator transcription factor [Bowmanella yangjiangensis]